MRNGIATPTRSASSRPLDLRPVTGSLPSLRLTDKVCVSEFRCAMTASRLTSSARSHGGSHGRAKAGEGHQGGNNDVDRLEPLERLGLDPGLWLSTRGCSWKGACAWVRRP